MTSGTTTTHAATAAVASPSTPTFDGHTSCSKVLYIGESTSIGMITPLQVPNASERLEARLRSVGAKSASVNISGGRAAIGRLLGRPNTMDVLTPQLTTSFDGCYLLALGVNDAADSAVLQSTSQMRLRIDLVMKRIGDRPVLWPLISTSTGRTPRYYQNVHMQTFNAQLREATKRYPKLRLYDWPTEMDTAWIEADGVHDRRIGSRERALMYSRALAVAFPRGLPMNTSTVVGSVWRSAPSPANRPSLPAIAGDRGSFWAGDEEALKVYTSGPKLP